MKVLAACVVLLACAHFQATSACTNNVIVLVEDGLGEAKTRIRQSLLVTYSNGKNYYLPKPVRADDNKVFYFDSDQVNKLTISAFHEVSEGVYNVGRLCEATLMPLAGEFQLIQCSKKKTTFVGVSYMYNPCN